MLTGPKKEEELTTLWEHKFADVYPQSTRRGSVGFEQNLA
jgi:hypothetical protein